MKTVIIASLCAFLWIPSFSTAGLGEPAPDGIQAAPAGAVHDEIERLRHDFERRRDNALRPSAVRYLAQLETLQKRVLEQNRTVETELADAVKAAREAYAQVDQPELRRALLSATWIWRSNDDHNGVVVAFHPDGTAEHIGMRGRWHPTGPNEITIAADGDVQYVLRFGASLRTFEGDWGGVIGTAMQSPVDTLCANLWSLRDDRLEFCRDGRLIQRGAGWEGRDWRLSEDGTHVTIRFTNGNGGTFTFENGTMTHFDGTPFERSPLNGRTGEPQPSN